MGHPFCGSCFPTTTPQACSQQCYGRPAHLQRKAQQGVSDLNGGACRKPLIHRQAFGGGFQAGGFSASGRQVNGLQNDAERYRLGTRYILSVTSCTWQQFKMLRTPSVRYNACLFQCPLEIKQESTDVAEKPGKLKEKNGLA